MASGQKTEEYKSNGAPYHVAPLLTAYESKRQTAVSLTATIKEGLDTQAPMLQIDIATVKPGNQRRPG
jgi:hypothetical protein